MSDLVCPASETSDEALLMMFNPAQILQLEVSSVTSSSTYYQPRLILLRQGLIVARATTTALMSLHLSHSHRL
jgi:hypothetical protein